jgi:asparagine synthase (glutamine-hydrolysing)
MVSDVEVGIFLSGGIDSSLVTAIIQSQNSLPIHTFTIGFDDPIYNEANHAASISSHLGTKHEELICNSKDFEELIPRIPEILDEPMGDSSIIPTFLLSSFASKKVKVSLSADGGDELFGGYTKYQATTDFYPKLKHIPSFIKGLAAKMGHQTTVINYPNC